MARQVPSEVTKGSRKWPQRLVNGNPGVLSGEIATHLGPGSPKEVPWRSPLRGKIHAEYGDDDILEGLGASLDRPFLPASLVG